MATVQVNFFFKCLMRMVTINAVIPVDPMIFPGMKVPEEKPFKTIYLLHGIFGNHFYADCEATGEKYGEFIGIELPAFCERLFPLSGKQEDRFIAGLSMGGYGAVRNGLKYHDIQKICRRLGNLFQRDLMEGYSMSH